jgi:Tol biopolymer transport system component
VDDSIVATPDEDTASKDRVDDAAGPSDAAPDDLFPTITGAHLAEGLESAGVIYSPSFAATGSAMYFQRETGRGSALMRADRDAGGRVVRLARVLQDGARNFHARPSPDGSFIAYDSDRDGTRGVYVARSDGRRVWKVSGDGYAAVPSWSPDGRQLAFVRGERTDWRVWNLWLLTVATGELERLTSYRVGQPWGASWFPDGQRVAYSHENALVVLNLNTGARQVYLSPHAPSLLRTPAVSPSGEEILFQVFRDGGWLLNVSTGAMRRVLDDPTAEEYAWSPDGQQVAYHSRRSGQWSLWLADVH